LAAVVGHFLAPTLDPQRILKVDVFLDIGRDDQLAPTLDPQRILKELSRHIKYEFREDLHPRSIRRGY